MIPWAWIELWNSCVRTRAELRRRNPKSIPASQAGHYIAAGFGPSRSFIWQFRMAGVRSLHGLAQH